MVVPRFEPFAGLRYARSDLSSVIAPPYDVISEEERVALEALDPFNSVRLELPQDEPGRNRYEAAAARLREWQQEGGPLVADRDPAFFVYRMSYAGEDGSPRATTGVIGALALEQPGEGDVLPHERTTPKAKSDRLDLLRATNVNLSPVWGLSLAGGLSARCSLDGPPDAAGTADGVRHEIWRVDSARTGEIRAAVESAPVVIADGHHRYEVALAYSSSAGLAGAGSVMTYVVELSEEQLTVAAIHRLIDGLPAGFDLAGALDEWFEPAGTAPVDGALPARLVAAGALALVLPSSSDARLLRPRAKTVEAAEKDLDSSRLDVALASLPAHDLTYQHGVGNVAAAVSSGRAQAGVLLRPATVAQIASVARARDRMPPKTTFFTPKPATGLVFRSLM
jgi:uncharacterized protein (DUF1015 family)